MRNRKTTKTNNIVIICEGTDTEYYYFNSIKKYVEKEFPELFSNILLLPVPVNQGKINNGGKRKRRPLDKNVNRYYYKEEDSEELYNKFKKQPTRYVREVELYMQQDGYTEGWAVFDKDEHPDHIFAFQYAKSVSSLHIAFSSYSFEQWFLLHFEKSDYPFLKSDCHDGSSDFKCGSINKYDDCRGIKCIAGALRERKYLSSYSKSSDDIFKKTFSKLEVAYENAAWLRCLLKVEPYETTAYTDVDLLVKRLLGCEIEYQWLTLNVPFNFERTKVVLEKCDDAYILKNIGSCSVLLTPSNVYVSKETGVKHPLLSANKLLNQDMPYKFYSMDNYLIFESSRKKVFLDLEKF